MNRIPLDIVCYCKKVDSDGRTSFHPFLVSLNNEVELISTKNHSICRMINGDIVNSLQWLLGETTKTENKFTIYGALDFEEFLARNSETANTLLAKKLHKTVTSDGTNSFTKIEKRVCMSENKLMKCLKEIETIKNKDLHSKKETQFER